MSDDPRREPDDPPPWHADLSGVRKMDLEKKLPPLPRPPPGKEEDPFFAFVQQHNEVQRMDRIALFLDNEDKAMAEERRRAGYLKREAERDERDRLRDERQDARDAEQATWNAMLLEDLKRVHGGVDRLVMSIDRLEDRVAGLDVRMGSVEAETRKNTLQLSRQSGCIGKLETNSEIMNRALKALGTQIATVDGQTRQIVEQFEVAITNEEARRHGVEHEVAELKSRLDQLERRFNTVEAMLKAELEYRRMHGRSAPEEAPGTADHQAGHASGPPASRRG